MCMIRIFMYEYDTNEKYGSNYDYKFGVLVYVHNVKMFLLPMQRTCKFIYVGAKEKAILEHGKFGPILPI